MISVEVDFAGQLAICYTSTKFQRYKSTVSQNLVLAKMVQEDDSHESLLFKLIQFRNVPSKMKVDYLIIRASSLILMSR